MRFLLHDARKALEADERELSMLRDLADEALLAVDPATYNVEGSAFWVRGMVETRHVFSNRVIRAYLRECCAAGWSAADISPFYASSKNDCRGPQLGFWITVSDTGA